MAGGARRETRVPVAGLIRGHQKAPGAAAVRGHLDVVVRDRAPTGRGRRVPVEGDDGRPGGGRHQVAGHARRRGRRRSGARRIRPTPKTPRPGGVPRPDPVVEGQVRGETRMMVNGRGRVPGQQRWAPDAADRRHFDFVARDRAPAGRGRGRGPVEDDGGGIGGDRPQVRRRIGWGLNRSRDGGRGGRHPPRRRGGDHEDAGWWTKLVPNHPGRLLARRKGSARVRV